MSQLTLRYQFDDTDDFGRLDVAVVTDKFAGQGGFWVQWQDIAEFGEQLSTYPIGADAPLSASWGYDMQQGENLILSISIAAANATGDLKVTVEVADEDERSERLRASFLTNYPDLERFQTGIGAIMNRGANETVLTGR